MPGRRDSLRSGDPTQRGQCLGYVGFRLRAQVKEAEGGHEPDVRRVFRVIAKPDHLGLAFELRCGCEHERDAHLIPHRQAQLSHAVESANADVRGSRRSHGILPGGVQVGRNSEPNAAAVPARVRRPCGWSLQGDQAAAAADHPFHGRLSGQGLVVRPVENDTHRRSHDQQRRGGHTHGEPDLVRRHIGHGGLVQHLVRPMASLDRHPIVDRGLVRELVHVANHLLLPDTAA